MDLVVGVLLGSAGLFLGMLALLEVGHRLGRARLARDPEGLARGTGALDAALFALLGLLMAFTFSGAAARFEDRRHLIREEANAIGTAYLRLELLPEADQPAQRELFRRYLDIRLQTYRDSNSLAEVEEKLAAAAALQREIWTAVVAFCKRPESEPNTALILLPALNQMIDITTTRVAATRNHPPRVIFLMLALISLLGSLLAGYSMAGSEHRSWLHMLVFAAIMSLSVYVILDLEFPRLGLIRVDAADQILDDLRKSMR